MTWFQVDDHLSDHYKVVALGADQMVGIGLLTLCGVWCADRQSEGFVPQQVADRYDPGLRVARRLVEVELWDDASLDGIVGYRFCDWADYQLGAAPGLNRKSTIRAAGRERQRRYRQRRSAELSEVFDDSAQSGRDSR